MISASTRRFQLLFTTAVLIAAQVFAASALGAQGSGANAGRVTGRVIDISSGQPLPAVAVQVVGLAGVGTNTNDSGRFMIGGIPAGTVTLQFRRIGYAAKTVTGIALNRNQTAVVDVTLDPNANVLLAEVVTAAAERGTVHEALNQQRASVGVVNSLTAEQISRSPDGDAAAAAQRISGLTITDGKYPNARGQQDRSTIANLNNVRIPSPEPEKKQVPFDLFPASLIRSIEVVKTFTPDMPGDFSGALVNIQTREFPARKSVSYSSSIGFNSEALGQKVLAAPTNASEWFAFADRSRRLPSLVRGAGNFSDRQYSQSEVNQMIGSFRNSWTPSLRSGLVNSSFGMSMGGNDPILGRQIGYIGTLTYSAGQEVRVDERRALIDFGTGNTPANEFRGSTGRTSVLWGGQLNLSSFVAGRHLITMNNMYNRTSDSEAHRDVGSDEGYGKQNILERTTLSYVERSVRSNQVAGVHPAGQRGELSWSLTNSAVTRREPDRSDMVYISTQDPVTGEMNPFELFTASSDGARRTFADLSEGSWNLATDYKLELGDPFKPRNLKFGGVARYTSRDAEVLQYSFATFLPLPVHEAQLSAEEIFDGRFTSGSQSVFTINPLGQSGSYSASDLLVAGYGMAEYGISERVRVIGGARVENSNVEVVTTNLFGFRDPVRRDFADVLPSLALNVGLSDNHQLRLSATRTLARPEYRELSPILNRDVLGGQGFRGDTSLVRTLINNYDLRWEWYPNPGELVSIALFAKYHDRPIERVEVPTSGTSVLSYINAEAAENYGVEVEFRKELGNIAWALAPLTVFGNVTLMTSEIRLGETGAASATNSNRPLAGQAPYVVNAGLTYAGATGRLSATALYNRVGKRITAAGPLPLPDVYEMPRDMLDLAVRFPVLSKLDGKLDLKNILDAPVEHRQGEVTRLHYRSGRTMGMGLSWKL